MHNYTAIATWLVEQSFPLFHVFLPYTLQGNPWALAVVLLHCLKTVLTVNATSPSRGPLVVASLVSILGQRMSLVTITSVREVTSIFFLIVEGGSPVRRSSLRCVVQSCDSGVWYVHPRGRLALVLYGFYKKLHFYYYYL